MKMKLKMMNSHNNCMKKKIKRKTKRLNNNKTNHHNNKKQKIQINKNQSLYQLQEKVSRLKSKIHMNISFKKKQEVTTIRPKQIISKKKPSIMRKKFKIII